MLVEVAISWHSTGTPEPLTKAQAVRLANDRVPGLGDELEAHAEACFDWACQRVTEGVALLTPAIDDAGATVAAHPELAAIVAAESEPDLGVWLAALDVAAAAADSEAVGQIGYTAHTADLNNIADQAWECTGRSPGVHSATSTLPQTDNEGPAAPQERSSLQWQRVPRAAPAAAPGRPSPLPPSGLDAVAADEGAIIAVAIRAARAEQCEHTGGAEQISPYPGCLAVFFSST